MEPRQPPPVRLRPKPRTAHASVTYAVFTAVDGVLLDPLTFEAGASHRAVQRLHAAGIPVIPVSVMTLEEIAPIAAELGLRDAMVIEAGGAIARWTSEGWEVEPCGPPSETLLEVVRDIEDRSGARLLIYSALPPSQAARLSGRSGEMLEASTHRRFSEPFVIESGSFDDVRDAAASIGFTVRRGRRFLHLSRDFDEGEAFSRLREELRCDTAIALGGSLLDAEFLSRADIPIIVPARGGAADSDLVERVPDARIAPSPAPGGWAAAIDAVLPALKRRRGA